MQIGKVCSFPAVECRKIRRLNLHQTVPGNRGGLALMRLETAALE